MKGILGGVSKALVATIVFLAIVESLLRTGYFIRNSMVTYIPLPYVIGHDYGPIPPWLDSLLLLVPEKTLIWRSRPNVTRRYVDIFSPVRSNEERISLLRRFVPSIPNSFKGNPVWEIALNSEGYRDREFPRNKPASAFRIICLGDSWTFGMNVGQEQTYPQRLHALLKREFPQANFEVLNRGVLGYSSYQGLELLRSRVLDLDPDVVVIGYAMNDSNVAGFRDKELAARVKHPPLTTRIDSVLQKSELYKLLRYLALIVKHKPNSIAYYLKEEAESVAEGSAAKNLQTLDPLTRVPLEDYEKNILEMIRLAKSRKAAVILVYNELWEDGPYLAVLKRISRQEGVPLVDSSAVIAGARKKIEAGLERKLGLAPLRTRPPRANGKIEVIFRVYLGKNPVPKAVYIVGTHPELGDLVPNTVAMYDDGTHGDQSTGDAVWTYSATLPRGMTLFYIYTNSGEEGKWQGLDVPHIREFAVEAGHNGGRVYRPIESFGKIYMQADGWHPDASGYELIAKSVFKALEASENVNEYLRRVRAGRR